MPNFARLLPVFLFVASLQSEAGAQSQDDLVALLAAARDAPSLTDPSLKPWHMRASFDLLDLKGTSTEHGTFEEWWAAPTHWHQRILSTSSNEDSYQMGDQHFSSATQHLSYLVQLLPQQLLHPVASDPASEGKITVTLKKQNFGPVQLDCLMVQHTPKPSDAPIFGTTPTYCLDPGKPDLRFFMEFGVQQFVRDHLGVFQKKSIALLVTIEEAGHPVIQAKVEQLQSETISDADLTPPPDLPASPFVAHVSSGVISGQRIGGNQPQYPLGAKDRRVSGTVLLHAVIGKDGHITFLEPIWSPDASLTQAAIAGVRTWTYTPYLLNGEPTEVETTITVHFNIGR